MRSSPDNFDRLTERHRLRGRLITRTAIHVGSGEAPDAAATDLPVLRDALERPFIPGSTIKGVIRSTIESLLRAADRTDRDLQACDPLLEREGDGACGYHKSEGRAASVKAIAAHCGVCRLFGSRVLASHVRFSDALAASDGPPARLELRDGVAIDRDLRVVHGSQKYDFEVVAPGAHFELEVFVDNPEDWSMGLLMMGFDQLKDGFSGIGGFTSRGLGRVDLEWDELLSCTADELLAGAVPRPVRGADLITSFQRWRAALAHKAGGTR